MPPRRGTAFVPFVIALGLASLARLIVVWGPLPPSRGAFAATMCSAGLLAAWAAVVIVLAKLGGRVLRLDMEFRAQHYLQACAQLAVYVYWGCYWGPVAQQIPFIVAQVFFAWTFDLLLSWWRRGSYTFGLGVLPIVFSINLFQWFKPEYFYLQLALVAVGLLAKEFFRWERGGRLVHIFNPSSFPLALCALALIATGRTDMTRGAEIASTQFFPPHMYLWLFLIGLPGQFRFGVTSMTMSAALSTYAFGRIYFALTGVYFFYDSYIPIAVFLGMHLLFTDPSTSPRSELGRIVFGAIYGISTVALYRLLGSLGLPTFYDKLLQVPLMNLSVRAIDRAAASPFWSRFDPAALWRRVVGYRRNLAYMSVWAVAFAGLSAAQGVGDDHPGQWFPFWRTACQDGRAFACPYLADLDLTACNRGSGWACNEAGLMDVALSRSGEDARRTNIKEAADPFRRGCDLGFATACSNLAELTNGTGAFAAAPPGIADYPVILRGSKGPLDERDPSRLLALACEQGWPGTCTKVAQ